MRINTLPDSRKVKLLKTALCVISFIGLGGCNTLLGSSLLDLQIRLQVTFSVVSNLVPARSIGYLVGSGLSSFVERYFSINVILFVTNFVAGLAIAIAPWYKSYILMYSFILISGFAQGLFDIVCNTYVLKIWRTDKNLATFVQILHGAFGIGALITPLISQSFLLPLSDNISEGDDSAVLGNYQPSDVKVQWAFLTITAFLFISSSGFLIFHVSERSKSVQVNETENVPEEVEPPRWKINTTITLLCMLANFSFGILVLVGSLTPSFAVKSDLHLSKKAGATMVTVFWIVLSIYKGFFVAATSSIGENRLLYFSYFCHLASVLIIVPYAASNIYCYWIGFNLLGIGFAPLFAVALSRIQKFFTLTNALASFIFINGAIGEAVHPWIASRMLSLAPINFTYYIGTLSLCNVMLCITVIFVSEKLFKNEKRRENFSRTTSIRSWT